MQRVGVRVTQHAHLQTCSICASQNIPLTFRWAWVGSLAQHLVVSSCPGVGQMILAKGSGVMPLHAHQQSGSTWVFD
jgi:hypothetical protein